MNAITRAEIELLVCPGDVIAVEYLKKDLTADIISGSEGDPASHALCCLGGLDIVEASSTGVIESNLRNYLRGNCRLTVRCANPVPNPEEARLATEFWLDRVNDPYDWGMIFGSAPIVIATKLLGLFSKRLSLLAAQKMPNLLASNALSTCAELGARGIHQFDPLVCSGYPLDNVTPGILRTHPSLTTKAILNGATLIG